MAVQNRIARALGYITFMFPVVYFARSLRVDQPDPWSVLVVAVGLGIVFFILPHHDSDQRADRLVEMIGVAALGGSIHSAVFAVAIDIHSDPTLYGDALTAFFADVFASISISDPTSVITAPLELYVLVGTVLVGASVAVFVYRTRLFAPLLVVGLIATVTLLPILTTSPLFGSISIIVGGLYLFVWPVSLLLVLGTSFAERQLGSLC